MLGGLTENGWPYKLACDGYDFSLSELGKAVMRPEALDYANRHCTISTFPKAEEFVAQCIKARQANEFDHPLTIELRDKYEVGLFVTSPHSCFDSDYVLFNRQELSDWKELGTNLWGLRFLVIPSRDRDGHINDIGFRLLDTSQVYDAFKWLFPLGQQCTFGLQHVVGNQIICVEGAFDYIALRESGVSNVVGLGGARLSEGHKRLLAGYDITMCLDQDNFGISERANYTRYCFFHPEGKDPFDAFIKHGKVSILGVEQ